jgi:hypothetical protein
MRDCIEAQERAFAGTLTGGSVSRPRIDMFEPCDRPTSIGALAAMRRDAAFAVGPSVV